MATCLTFVFLALVEFAVVNVLTRDTPKLRSDDVSTKDQKSGQSASGTRKTIKVAPEPDTVVGEQLVD